MGNWVGHSMSNWVSNSMGNWVGHSMSNWMSNNSWMCNSMSNGVSCDGSILCFSLISYISNIAIIVIGMILDMLGATIRKVNRVRSINNTSTIVRLSLIEGSTRVVISNSI